MARRRKDDQGLKQRKELSSALNRNRTPKEKLARTGGDDARAKRSCA